MPTIKLTYFDIEGAAEKVRLAFSLGNVEFEDERIKFEDWPALKPNTPYGQLPLMTLDGGAPMAQSGAMLRYAGTLANGNGVALYPAEKMVEIEEALGLVDDISLSFRNPVYVALDPTKFGHSAEFKGTAEHGSLVKTMREKFMAEDFPRHMGVLEKRLGQGDYLNGSAPTIADCALVPILRRFRSGKVDHVPVDCLDKYSAVSGYLKRFLALPAVAKWYNL